MTHDAKPSEQAIARAFRIESANTFDASEELNAFYDKVIERAREIDASRTAPQAAGVVELPWLKNLHDYIGHCVSAADEGVPYATPRSWLDAMTTLGLMEKCGRGRWRPTADGEQFASIAYGEACRQRDVGSAEVVYQIRARLLPHSNWNDVTQADYEEALTRPDLLQVRRLIVHPEDRSTPEKL